MTIKNKSIIIAIDGHSSCGKSTIAKQLANKLNMLYVDSGAMYRAVTLFAIQNDIFVDNKMNREKLILLLPKIKIDFKRNKDKITTILNGKNVESLIRSMEISEKVSYISTISEVRVEMVNLQRKMAEHHDIIMDGRDIGTVVFPNADLKIFLTANTKIRAERRYLELKSKGDNIDFETVLNNVETRDKIDSTRDVSPLKQAKDSIIIDNSNMTPKEQLEYTLNIINQKLK
jgi:cytidylate kinase